MHLNLEDAVPRTGLAAPALDIEAEPALGVAFGLGIRRCREQIPDLVKDARIGGRVRAGRTANRGLVDVYDLVQLRYAFDGLVLPGDCPGAV